MFANLNGMCCISLLKLVSLYFQFYFHADLETIKNFLRENAYPIVIGVNKGEGSTFDDLIESFQHLIVNLPDSVRRKNNCSFFKDVFIVMENKMETKEMLIKKIKKSKRNNKKKQKKDFGKTRKASNKNKL